MKRYLKEILILLAASLFLFWQIQNAEKSRQESRTKILEEILWEYSESLPRSYEELKQIVSLEVARQESYLQFHPGFTAPSQDTTIASLDFLTARFLSRIPPQGHLGLLQAEPFEISSRVWEVLKDVSAHKQEFVLPERDGYDYFVYTIPAKPHLPQLNLCIAWPSVSIFYEIGIWFYISILGFFILFGFFWYQSVSIGVRSLPSSLRTISLIIVSLILAWALGWDTAKQMQSNRQRLLAYQNEIRILKSGNIKPLSFDYREIRHLLPFEEEAIYSLNRNGERVLWQVQHKKLIGIREPVLNSSAHIISSGILFFILFVFFLIWVQKRHKQEVSQLVHSLADIRKPGSLSADHVPVFDTDLNHLFHKIQETSLAIQQRDVQQKLMGRELFVKLSQSVGTEPGNNSQCIHSICLLISPNQQDSLHSLSARDWFENLNRYVFCIREAAQKVDGIVFYESGFQMGILFCGKEYEAVLLQRSMICGLDILKQLGRKWSTLDEELQISGQIFDGKLSLMLGETSSRQEILLGGSLMNHLESSLKHTSFPGLTAKNSLLERHPNLLFDTQNLNSEQRQILGVKDLKEHLSLLAIPSPELQRTALDLASLQHEPQILKTILSALPTFDESVLAKTMILLKDYTSEDHSLTMILSHLEEWLEDSNPEIRNLALRLYGELPLRLDEEALEKLLSKVKSGASYALLRLVLRHYQGRYRKEWDLIFLDAPAVVQAEWGHLCFTRFHMPSGLDQMAASLIKAKGEEILQILGFFRRLEEQKSGFLQWYKIHGTELSRFLASILRQGERVSSFRVLQVIGALNLEEFFEDLVLRCEKSLDSDLKKEILNTLKQLGADAFMTTGVTYADS
ncbi:MAG: hypothetical protein H3C47_08810 [Candidatus Cloacimonetes bacterium]|nr:hypothetical protein [Candidatus Cloacimonadota bacterium]